MNRILKLKTGMMLLALASSVCMTASLRAEDAQTSQAQPEEYTPPQDIDWSQLATDPPQTINKPLKPGRKAAPIYSNDANWKRDDKPDGSSAVTVKQPIVPFWDTRIGADMNVAPDGPV
ncbi:MAG: hypothetical protein J0I29_04700, partial [Rhizobiales bacterium]|nr:hypothetical protein [Hyphomicrobiales bacterium]